MLGMETYGSEAVATAHTTIIVIPKKAALNIIGDNKNINYEFSVTFSSYASDKKINTIEYPDIKNYEETAATGTLVGWMVVILTPILSYYYFDGLDNKNRAFTAIILTMLLSWIFKLLPDFIPALFALLLCMGFGIADPKFILSGFSSKTFLMALSFFGIGAVIVSSGILLRILLSLVKYLPPKHSLINFTIFTLGTCLIPVIPDVQVRVAVMGNIFYDTLSLLRIKTNSAIHQKTITNLAFLFISSISLLGPVFLSSSMRNFILLGLFWGQYQQAFQWMGWLKAAAVSGAFLLAGYFIVHFIMFRKLEKLSFSKDLVKAQSQILGPISSHEWSSILSVVICFLGMATTTYHQITPEIISLLVLGSLLAFNFLRPTQFQNKIPWQDLMFLAGLSGLSNTAQQLGLLDIIGAHFQWIADYIDLHFAMFVLMLQAIIIIVRTFVPSGSTVIVFCSVLIPLTQANGTNPWIISFLVLMLSEIWFLPAQKGEYKVFRSLTKESQFDETKLLLTNMLLNFVKVGAIFASIPYWRSLGLIS
jgi:di/tricarboxylate transporter